MNQGLEKDWAYLSLLTDKPENSRILLLNFWRKFFPTKVFKLSQYLLVESSVKSCGCHSGVEFIDGIGWGSNSKNISNLKNDILQTFKEATALSLTGPDNRCKASLGF